MAAPAISIAIAYLVIDVMGAGLVESVAVYKAFR
jgi:hypothetical protein